MEEAVKWGVIQQIVSGGAEQEGTIVEICDTEAAANDRADRLSTKGDIQDTSQDYPDGTYYGVVGLILRGVKTETSITTTYGAPNGDRYSVKTKATPEIFEYDDRR